MPRINLLPWRAELRQKRKNEFLVALLGTVIALPLSAQQTFKVRLRPVPIEAATAANTTGAGEATAQLAGTIRTLRTVVGETARDRMRAI